MPLDSNILVAILIFAALIVYVFVLRKLGADLQPLKPIIEKNRSKTNNKKVKEKKNPPKEIQENSHEESDSSCWHDFGYLGTLPKNSKIPDECLGCPRIVKCLAHGR